MVVDIFQLEKQQQKIIRPGNPYWKGRNSTVDFLVLTSLKIYISFFYKTSYLNVEVNSTEPSPWVNFPWLDVDTWQCQNLIVILTRTKKYIGALTIVLCRHPIPASLTWFGYGEFLRKLRPMLLNFFVRNLRIFVIDYSVCHCQAFPAWSNAW